MASVYKDKNGRWVASESCGVDKFGKRIRKVFYADSKKEVQSKLNDFLFEKKTGDYQEKLKVTLVDFLNEYYDINKIRWEETTKQLYRMYIDIHIKPYFEKMKLVSLKPSELDKFYNFKLTDERKVTTRIGSVDKTKTLKPLSANSVKKLNTFIKASLNYAMKNNLIKTNPCNNVTLSKTTNYTPYIYSEKQFLNLLDEVDGTDDEIPIILGAGCGLRRGEIFGLRWKNIDFTNKTITIEKTNVRFSNYIVKNPKNETSQRTFSAPGYVLNSLRLFQIRSKHSQPNDIIVAKWKPDAYSKRFKKLLKDYKMEPIRLHDLRHYNAVIMMKKNIPDKVAAERLGHSNIQTLRKVYQHVLKDI